MAVSAWDIAYDMFKAGTPYQKIADETGLGLSAIKSRVVRKWKKASPEPTRMQPNATTDTDATEGREYKCSEDSAKGYAISAISKSEELSERQRLFCIYWIKNKNATMAAIKAGYSPESAHVQGSQLLKNPKIRAFIDAYISNVARSVMLETSEIVERYMKIAFSDMTDFVDFYQESVPLIVGNKIASITDEETGKQNPIMKTVNAVRFKDAMSVDGGLICEISQGRDGAKLKLEDRQKALDWLSKFFLMNPLDKHRVEYDNQRLAMEAKKLEQENPHVNGETLLNRRYIEASLDFWKFCNLKVPNIYTDKATYLKAMCRKLQNFIEDVDGEQVAIFNLPPGHGKTLTAKLFSEWVLGRDKLKKLMSVAYNHEFATDFSKSVRDAIDEEKIDANIPVFRDIFYDVQIEQGSAQAKKWKLSGSPEYNFLAVSPGSASTGYRAHLAIIDDVIKGAYEANHRQHLDSLWDWFSNTFYSRREQGRKIAVFSTRWATKDLCGRLIENCITNNRPYTVMTRKAFDGENMLNPDLLSKADYDDVLTVLGEDIAKANYD